MSLFYTIFHQVKLYSDFETWLKFSNVIFMMVKMQMGHSGTKPPIIILSS